MPPAARGRADAAGCGPGAPHADRRTPVILISIDTMRADRLPAYGYGAVATPAIDRLARDSVVFDEAFTASPLTLHQLQPRVQNLFWKDRRLTVSVMAGSR